MSELQNDADVSADDLTIDSVEAEVEQSVENSIESAELAPASEENHEEKTQADVNQEAINKAINKKHFEAKQAEREAAEYKRKFEELQQQQQQQQMPQVSDVQPTPDAFDDDYESKVAERDRIMTQNAQVQYAQQQQQQYAQHAQQQKQMEQQQELVSKAQEYSKRAASLGVSSEELKTAGDMLGAYGVNDHLVNAILADDNGPLISKHLATNPIELESLNNAIATNPILAGTLYNEIREKASSLKPKTTKAPAPAERLDGGHMDNEMKDYPHVAGGFE